MIPIKGKTSKEAYILLVILILLIAISYVFFNKSKYLSNNEIIEYTKVKIDSLNNNDIVETIRNIVYDLEINCDNYRILSYSYDYHEVICNETIIKIKEISRYLFVDLTINMPENYIIFYFVPQGKSPDYYRKDYGIHLSKEKKEFGVIFSYYEDKPLIITKEKFPDFEIIWGEQRPTENEKWIYIIDNDWAIYVP